MAKMAISPKKSAQEILNRLPEDADWGRIMYELYVNQKIEQSLKAVAEGRVVSHEEVKRQLLGDEG
ncbi:hypothetical protein [Dongia sp.]|uniref:hypothetical protein n=1 Tax=Dongia sp. TaxID=1977262 RepID=UPI0037519B5E